MSTGGTVSHNKKIKKIYRKKHRYRIGPLDGQFYTEILSIWEAGSLFFLAGAVVKLAFWK
jgi:hypothetical protein